MRGMLGRWRGLRLRVSETFQIYSDCGLLLMRECVEWARARIAKDHRFRTGVVDKHEKEIIAGVPQQYYD